MRAVMTLFRLLTEGTRALEQAGAPDAGLDARQLLLAAFHIDMTHFLLKRMEELPEDDYYQTAAALYREMIAKRRRRMPLQQILGNQEFMGLTFYVNKHVLIPRQDTETLVELVLQDSEAGCRGNGEKHTLLDLCTGSGCIAVSLAAKGNFTYVTATDLSEEALKVARRNAACILGSEWNVDGICDKSERQIVFCQGNLFAALPQDGRRYDVITANPPYIPTAVIAGLEPEVRDYEPMMALDGSQDGLECYRQIAAKAEAYLADGGRLYLEIGYDQGAAVCALLEDAGYQNVRVCKDLSGNDRVVCAGWNFEQMQAARQNGDKK